MICIEFNLKKERKWVEKKWQKNFDSFNLDLIFEEFLVTAYFFRKEIIIEYDDENLNGVVFENFKRVATFRVIKNNSQQPRLERRGL